MEMKPVEIDNAVVMGIEVALPQTNLLILTTDTGYIMCGALDIQLLNDKLHEREIVAARAVGVKTLEDLLDAPLESVTHAAKERGIAPGMSGREALSRMVGRAAD